MASNTVYITALDVSTNYEEEQDLKSKSFQKIDVNLNEGTEAGNNIYLWFQTGYKTPITRVQVTFKPEMEAGLNENHFIQIEKDLNSGTSGDPLYMWYSRATGDHDVPITAVQVTVNTETEAECLTTKGEAWEQVSCDLNLGAGGKFVYVWVKRERATYIGDVSATNSYSEDHHLLSSGYTRIDVNTNMGVEGAKDIFIWYRKTLKESEGVTDMKVSVSKPHPEDKDGFKVVDTNLNEGTASKSEVYLLYKKQDGSQRVRGMGLMLKPVEKKSIYKNAGVTVIEGNLNNGNEGDAIYVCYVHCVKE